MKALEKGSLDGTSIKLIDSLKRSSQELCLKAALLSLAYRSEEARDIAKEVERLEKKSCRVLVPKCDEWVKHAAAGTINSYKGIIQLIHDKERFKVARVEIDVKEVASAIAFAPTSNPLDLRYVAASFSKDRSPLVLYLPLGEYNIQFFRTDGKQAAPVRVSILADAKIAVPGSPASKDRTERPPPKEADGVVPDTISDGGTGKVEETDKRAGAGISVLLQGAWVPPSGTLIGAGGRFYWTWPAFVFDLEGGGFYAPDALGFKFGLGAYGRVKELFELGGYFDLLPTHFGAIEDNADELGWAWGVHPGVAARVTPGNTFAIALMFGPIFFAGSEELESQLRTSWTLGLGLDGRVSL